MDYSSLPVEISITGIYFPPLLFASLVGAAMMGGIFHLMNRYELVGYVWHPPLFYLALTVICTCLVGIYLIPI